MSFIASDFLFFSEEPVSIRSKHPSIPNCFNVISQLLKMCIRDRSSDVIKSHQMTSCISFLHEWLKNFSVLACTPPSCSNAAKYDKGMNYK